MIVTVNEERRAPSCCGATATPAMIAAAWRAWKDRHGEKLGPGPGFIEAINAALRPTQDAPCQCGELQTEVRQLRYDNSQLREVARRAATAPHSDDAS